MKKVQEICSEIQKEIKEQMYDAIMMRDDRMYYEKEYGTAFIAVDIYTIPLTYGRYMTMTDVYVAHEDAKHESPLLTAAVKEVIPDWDKMKYDLRYELEETYTN